MMALYGPMLVLLVFVLAGAAGYVVGRGAARQPGVDAATIHAVRHEISELRALVNRIKDTAWDQRELDPALSTIIIEEIRAHERRELGDS